MYTNGTEPNEAPTLAATSTAAEGAGTVAPETGGLLRRLRLSAGWHFTRHLMEMIVAMFAGMVVLGVAIWMLGEPPGYANTFVEYGLMGAFMSAPMVAWMRYRGHTWADGLEMTAAMLVPTFALVLAAELGAGRYVPALSGHALMMLSHVAMIAGMAALMIFRWDRYALGHHA